MSRKVRQRNSYEALDRENEELRARLEEVQEVLAAIRTGRVDALAMQGPDGEKIYTLEGADHPYRTFVETMNEGALTISTDGTILYCNQVVGDLIGLPLEQILGTPLSRFVEASCLPLWETFNREALGSRRRTELSLSHADGTVIPVQMSARSIASMSAVCIVVTDLRGQKLQEKLRESEERFRTLADNMSQFAWMADATGSLFWYNRRWYDYTGTTFDDMQGWGWKTVHHPDHVERVVETWRRALATGEPWEDTFPLRGGDGTYRWFLSRAQPIRDKTGAVVRWFGTNTDITQLREAESALQASEARLQSTAESLALAQRASMSGVWDWNMTTGEVYVSPEYRGLYGFTHDEPVTFERWLSAVHYEDRPAMEAEGRCLFESGTDWTVEFRIVHPERGLRWLAGIGRLERDAAGVARRFSGVNLDITDRKQAELGQRRSEERLRLALEAGQMGAWDVDLITGAVTYDAKEYELFGLRQDDRPTDVNTFYARVHPDDVMSLKHTVAQAEITGSFAHEFRIVRTDGAVRWIAGIGAALKDEQGRPVRMVGVHYDVTDRRETEARLRASPASWKHSSRDGQRNWWNRKNGYACWRRS